MSNHTERHDPKLKNKIGSWLKSFDPADLFIYPTVASIAVLSVGAIVGDDGNVGRNFAQVGALLLLPLLLLLFFLFCVAPAGWVAEKTLELLRLMGAPKLVSNLIAYSLAFLVFAAILSFCLMYFPYSGGLDYDEPPMEAQLPWY